MRSFGLKADDILGGKKTPEALTAQLPSTPVSPDARRRAERVARRYRISLAAVTRAAYVCAGIFEDSALDEDAILPPNLVAFIRKHRRFPEEGEL